MRADRGSESEGETTAASGAALGSDLPWLTVLFVAVLWTFVRTMGASPNVWTDTLIENLYVDDCLVRDQCTTVGVGATVGIFHSAGYLHWRALLSWIGFNPDATHVLLLTMNALGVVLVALAARRLAGRAAGAAAAILMTASTGIATQLQVISDVAPVPFFGAVFLLVALTATERPSLGMTATLGLVGGVMANVYVTCVLCAVSAVWIALLLPHRRWAHAIVAAVSFAVATFAIAPGTWIVDVGLLFSTTLGNRNPANPGILLDLPIARLALWAILAWGAAAVTGRASLRRQLDVPFAIIFPLFLPLAAGSWTETLDPQDKYGAHVIGAVAVGIAIPLVVTARGLGRWAVRRSPRLAAGSFSAAMIERLAPYAAAGMIVIGSGEESSLRIFNFRDLVAVQHILADEHGWAWPRASRNLKTPDDTVRQALLRWPSGWPDSGREDDLQRAYLVKVPASTLPHPLPTNMVVVNSTRSYAALLAFACSWIDWRAFRVCVKGADHTDEVCAESGLPTAPDAHSDNGNGLPGMPAVDLRDPPRQTMTLYLPLKPRQECSEEMIYMPRLPGMCPGHIVSVDGGTSEIEDSGRRARLKLKESATGATPTELVVALEVGGRECRSDYRGYPPFFVEGDPATVAPLATILERERIQEQPKP